jgi:hypothetical protein
VLLEGRDALRHIVMQYHHGCEPSLRQDPDPPQHRVENRLQARALFPVNAGGRRCNNQQRQPLMSVYLHQDPILPPTLPPAEAEGGDVLGRTLRPVLEVVAAEARWLLVHWVQQVEPPEQTHRRSHPHEHRTKVGEDRDQRDGVRR